MTSTVSPGGLKGNQNPKMPGTKEISASQSMEEKTCDGDNHSQKLKVKALKSWMLVVNTLRCFGFYIMKKDGPTRRNYRFSKYTEVAFLLYCLSITSLSWLNFFRYLAIINRNDIPFICMMIRFCNSIEKALIITSMNMTYKCGTLMVHQIEDNISNGLLPDNRLQKIIKVNTWLIIWLIVVAVTAILQVICFEIFDLWSETYLESIVLPWHYNELDPEVARALVIIFSLFSRLQLVGLFALGALNIGSSASYWCQYKDINSDIITFIKCRNNTLKCFERQCIDTMETHRKKNESICEQVKVADDYVKNSIGVALAITVAMACLTLYNLSEIDTIGDTIDVMAELTVTLCHLFVLFGCGICINSQVKIVLSNAILHICTLRKPLLFCRSLVRAAPKPC